MLVVMVVFNVHWMIFIGSHDLGQLPFFLFSSIGCHIYVSSYRLVFPRTWNLVGSKKDPGHGACCIYPQEMG